jgi:hypothetical protein
MAPTQEPRAAHHPHDDDDLVLEDWMEVEDDDIELELLDVDEN